MIIKTLNPTGLLKDETFKVRDTDEPAVNALVEDIKENGIVQPVLVREVDERYQLLDGRHRCEAAIIAGVQVPALVMDAKEDVKAWTLAVGANQNQKEFTGFDKYRTCSKLRESGLSVTEAAKVMRLSDARIYAIQQIGVYPLLVDSLRDRKLDLEACCVAAKALHAKGSNPAVTRQVVGEVKRYGRVLPYETCIELIEGITGNTNRRETNRQRNTENGRTTKVIVFDKRTPVRKLRRLLSEVEAIRERIRELLNEQEEED